MDPAVFTDILSPDPGFTVEEFLDNRELGFFLLPFMPLPILDELQYLLIVFFYLCLIFYYM